MSTEQIVSLDPTKVLADDNVRFSLKKERIKALAESILNADGVNDAVEVEALEKGKHNGFTHRLTAGFYRHAAVSLLNKDSGAGLKLPAVVRQRADAVDRLKRQVSENNDRENLSPIDTAVAIKKLMDAGVPTKEVQAIFARPGGPKGMTITPVSPAFITQSLRFLELPKSVQERIHDGRVGVNAAFELLRADPDKREAILERVEANRLAVVEREAEKEAESEEKVAARQAKVDEAKAAADAAAREKAEAQVAHEAAMQAAKDARKVPENFMDLSKEEKGKIGERVAAAKTDLRGAEQRVSKATVAEDKAARALRALTEPKAPKTPAEAPAKAAKPAKVAKVTPGEVKKAAKEVGSTKVRPLSLSEVKEAITELLNTKDKRVLAMVTAFESLILGKLSAKETAKALAAVK